MITVTLADVDRESRKSHLFPAFSPTLEARYRTDNINEQHKFVAMSWIIGLLMNDSFIIGDIFATKNEFFYYFVGRICICTPVCLLSLYGMKQKNKFYETFVNLAPVLFTATLSILLMIGHGKYRSYYLFGDLLPMICGCAMSRSRLRYAIPTVLAQYSMYQAVVLISDIVSPEIKIVDSMFGICGVVLSLVTVYAIEHINRRPFLLSLRVRLLNEELTAMTLTDPLTRLGNRRAYEEATQRLWSTSSDEAHLASFILIDIDRFKSFNDNYGHSAGDLCLTTVGRCIASQMRTGKDVAVRFGGEEFVVFLPDTDFTEARQVAEQVRSAILSAAIPHPVLAPDAVVSASLGVATALTSEYTPAELVIRADMALYAAKHNGRNQVWPPLGSTQAGLSRPATLAAMQDEERAA